MASNQVLKNRIVAFGWATSLVVLSIYSLFNGLWPLWPVVTIHLIVGVVLLTISEKIPTIPENLYFPIHASMVWPLMGLAYVLFEISTYFEELYPDNKVVESASQTAQTIGFLLDKLIFSKMVMIPARGIAQVLHFVFLKNNRSVA